MLDIILYFVLYREELQRTADMLTYSSNEASTALLKLISKECTSFKTIYVPVIQDDNYCL